MKEIYKSEISYSYICSNIHTQNDFKFRRRVHSGLVYFECETVQGMPQLGGFFNRCLVMKHYHLV